MGNILFKKNSIKNLSFGKNRISGRNNSGKITHYHRGGGCSRLYRCIDFTKSVWNVYGLVTRLEYDPNRSSIVSLIVYSNGIITYNIAQESLMVGDSIINSPNYFFKVGNSTLLHKVPLGIRISCLELSPNSGSQLVRSAGTYSTIISKFADSVLLKFKSNRVVKLDSDCLATIGTVSNFQYSFRNFKRAGYFRLRGWLPVVRGVAMNPVDHPHGGGQGKTSGGRPSVTPWGVITKGKPTVKKKR